MFNTPAFALITPSTVITTKHKMNVPGGDSPRSGRETIRLRNTALCCSPLCLSMEATLVPHVSLYPRALSLWDEPQAPLASSVSQKARRWGAEAMTPHGRCQKLCPPNTQGTQRLGSGPFGPKHSTSFTVPLTLPVSCSLFGGSQGHLGLVNE